MKEITDKWKEFIERSIGWEVWVESKDGKHGKKVWVDGWKDGRKEIMDFDTSREWMKNYK